MSIVDFPVQGTIGTNLLPKRFDITLYQGDTFQFNLTLSGTGGPINLTGWSAEVDIQKTSDNSVAETPEMTATIDAAPTTGIIHISLSSTGTAALNEATEYKYDVQCTDSAGNVRTFIGGLITVTDDISVVP